jgi:uncharacterized delta-60 repeat protein
VDSILHSQRGRLAICSGLLLILSMLLAVPAPAGTDPWHLDPGFGEEGEVVTTFGGGFDEVSDVAVQSDGKIVVVGQAESGTNTNLYAIALARYKADGTLDPTFGNSGKVLASYPEGTAEGRALAIQPDGKIVVVGERIDGADPTKRPGTLITRFTADGHIDQNFGVQGSTFTRFGSLSEATDVAIVPQSAGSDAGKIVVAGFAADPTKQTTEFLVTRYTPAGKLEASFEPDPGLGDDIARAIAVDGGGRMIVVGNGVSSEGSRAEVAVLQPNGEPDTSFGVAGDGFYRDGYGNHSVGWGVALDPTQSSTFFVGGEVQGLSEPDGSTTSDMAVWKFHLSSAAPERSLADFFQKNDVARGVLVQADGKPVLVGWSAETGTGGSVNDLVYFALARFNTNLSPDSTFGDDTRFGNGSNLLVAGFAFGYDAALSAALQSDGDIVAAGGTNQAPHVGGEQIDFGVARFTGPNSETSDIKVRVRHLPIFELRVKPETFPVSWSASGVPLGGTVTFDVRTRSARWHERKFEDWRIVATKTPKTRMDFSIATPGTTLCFSARAHGGGETSAWSPQQCTAAPVDDRTLSATGHWNRGPAPAYYRGTFSGAGRKGVELHLDEATFAHLAVLVGKCPTCGRFEILIDGERAADISTKAPRDIANVLVDVDLLTNDAGRHDVTIKVLDPGGRGVYIDALGVSLA